MGGKNGLEAVEKTLIDRAVISAVSYTHLDVYKRQALIGGTLVPLLSQLFG